MRIILLSLVLWLGMCSTVKSESPWLSLKAMLSSTDRDRLLESANEIDRWCDHEGVITGAPQWMTEGLDEADRTNRTSSAVSLLHAEVLDRIGRTYGIDFFRWRAHRLRQTVRRRFGVVADASDDEYLNEIRPGGVNGQAFWNGRATLFMYAPSFDFKPVAGAAKYRFRVTDDALEVHEFVADRPTASLRPVWRDLDIGFVRVECYALDAQDNLKALAGERRFWKQAPFEVGTYPKARRSYVAARKLIAKYLLNTPEAKRMAETGAPDLKDGSNFTSYPSKMQSAMIHAMASAIELLPARREFALKVARACGDYLLQRRQPAGSPLEYFTPTYEGQDQTSGAYGGQNMLLYPAEAGAAWLVLAKMTGDNKYREAALRTADTYLRLQGEDGTWYLKMWERTGEPVTPNRLVPITIIGFLEAVYAETGEAKYRQAADRAFAFIEAGPLTDWNWEGQFEDIAPAKTKYFNLTKHNACETAIYLLKRFPGDARRLKQAREIVRFAEDQFVCWRPPARADGKGQSLCPRYPYRVWVTPAVLEQYNCYSPIDASAAKLVRTYMALYRTEGRPADLAKARALGDAITNNQDADGRVRTYFVPSPDEPEGRTFRQPPGGDWYNCMQADAQALETLGGVDGNDPAQARRETNDGVKVSVDEVRAALAQMPAGHPRLFVPRRDAFQKLRETYRLNPERRKLAEQILKKADEILALPVVQRTMQGKRMCGQEVFQPRAWALAMAYQLTLDRKYAQRAIREARAVAAWKDWNPSHFLDTSTMLMGLAVVYDWLYDELTEDDRRVIVRAISHLGLDAADSSNGWWKVTPSNWQQVCWCGVATGALAIYECEPERCAKIICEAVKKLPLSAAAYAPKGGYPEGPGYWNFGTMHFVVFMDLLQNALGTDYGLSRLPGVLETGYYQCHVLGPTDKTFNHSDNSSGRNFRPALVWLYNRLGRTDLEQAEWRRLNLAEKASYKGYSALLFFWHDFDAPATAVQPLPLDYVSGGRNPILCSRSDWTTNAAFVAVKGGRCAYFHGHQDVGSFVFDLDGVRWIEDLGGQNYYQVEKTGMNFWDLSPKSDRWKVYRLSPQAHNLVTIGDYDLNVNGFAPIEDDVSTPERFSATVNLTATYAQRGATSAARKVELDRVSRTLTLRDDFGGIQPGMPVRWAVITGAHEVQVEGNAVLLTDGHGRAARLTVALPAAVAWQVKDITNGPNVWDEKNPGRRQLSFTLPANADGTYRAVVTLAPSRR